MDNACAQLVWILRTNGTQADLQFQEQGGVPGCIAKRHEVSKSFSIPTAPDLPVLILMTSNIGRIYIQQSAWTVLLLPVKAF